MGAGWCWQLGRQGHGDGTGTLRCPVELSADLRKVSQCPQEAPNKALRIFAKQGFLMKAVVAAL